MQSRKTHSGWKNRPRVSLGHPAPIGFFFIILFLQNIWSLQSPSANNCQGTRGAPSIGWWNTIENILNLQTKLIMFEHLKHLTSYSYNLLVFRHYIAYYNKLSMAIKKMNCRHFITCALVDKLVVSRRDSRNLTSQVINNINEKKENWNIFSFRLIQNAFIYLNFNGPYYNPKKMRLWFNSLSLILAIH